MTVEELMADLPLPPGDARQALLLARILLRYLADHVYDAKLRDASDFKHWLEALAEAARGSGDWACRKFERSRFHPYCPRCGHVHQGEAQCGVEMGGAGLCRCELEVSA